MKQRQLLVRIETRFRRHQLENVDSGQGPAVTSDHGPQFTLALGQRDVEAGLPLSNAFQQKLQRHGGLAGPGAAFDQIDPVGIQVPAQDVVQPGAAG